MTNLNSGMALLAVAFLALLGMLIGVAALHRRRGLQAPDNKRVQAPPFYWGIPFVDRYVAAVRRAQALLPGIQRPGRHLDRGGLPGLRFDPLHR